jgi:succinyl-CoA synthetase beta subunit
MQLSGLRHGSRLLQLVEFPMAEFIDGSATNQEIQQFLEKHRKLVVKPAFYGGVGKKGKAGLVRVVSTLQEALAAKRELFFAQHTYGNKVVTANGVTTLFP